MKNKINRKVKVLIAGIVLMLFNIIAPNLDAVQFNVPSKSDGETNKEYTAKLLDLQLDTIMPLSLDEFDDFSDSDNSINVIGSVQINKKIDNDNVKYLDEMPQVYLVDSKDNIISTADIYFHSDIYQVPSDIYYISFYDLKIENEKEYKILVKINDEEKEISKYITYSDNIAVSPGNNLSMTYYSNSNILTISFEISNADTNEVILGDLDGNGIVDANDASIVLDLYKYNNATEEQLDIADIDKNGIIDANDASLILDIYKYGN